MSNRFRRAMGNADALRRQRLQAAQERQEGDQRQHADEDEERDDLGVRPPAMWGCREHWLLLPKRFRDAIWATYVPGQEQRMDPTPEYLDVAFRVQEWCRDRR